MKTNASVAKEVIHWLEASDLHALIKRAQLVPAEFGEFYSVKVEAWNEGLKIILKENLNVAEPVKLK